MSLNPCLAELWYSLWQMILCKLTSYSLPEWCKINRDRKQHHCLSSRLIQISLNRLHSFWNIAFFITSAIGLLISCIRAPWEILSRPWVGDDPGGFYCQACEWFTHTPTPLNILPAQHWQHRVLSGCCALADDIFFKFIKCQLHFLSLLFHHPSTTNHTPVAIIIILATR